MTTTVQAAELKTPINSLPVYTEGRSVNAHTVLSLSYFPNSYQYVNVIITQDPVSLGSTKADAGAKSRAKRTTYLQITNVSQLWETVETDTKVYIVLHSMVLMVNLASQNICFHFMLRWHMVYTTCKMEGNRHWSKCCSNFSHKKICLKCLTRSAKQWKRAENAHKCAAFNHFQMDFIKFSEWREVVLSSNWRNSNSFSNS